MAAVRAECRARIADAAAPAPADEHFCCTNSQYQRNRDKKPAIRRAQSWATAPQSLPDLHTQKIFPWKSGTRARVNPRAQTPAIPRRGGVRGYRHSYIRGSWEIPKRGCLQRLCRSRNILLDGG